MEVQTESKLNLSWTKGKRDKHIDAVIKIAESLSGKFPDSGVGISGSVSRLEHKETSDIDLLVIDNSFVRNRQCVFFNCFDLKINVFCISPKLLDERFYQWTISFIAQQINYFNSSKIIYDPRGILLKLQQYATNSINHIQSSDSVLIQRCQNEIKNIVNQTKAGTFTLQHKYYLIIYLTSLWFLRKGIKLTNKQEHLNAFETIKKIDKDFYDKIYFIQFSNTEVKLNNIQKLLSLLVAQ